MSGKLPIYSKAQIEKYFARIRLPSKYHKFDVTRDSDAEALVFLGTLQKYHLSEVPFENLSMHYSSHRQITLHVDELYKKIVESDCRGGYCMENNRVFGILLKSLGFKLYSAGARVRSGPSYSGWGHMVNLVTIGEEKYMVDVGFGGNGPIHPLKLDRSGQISPHITPASTRVTWGNIKENTDSGQRLWIYEHRFNDESEFQQIYCFTELEFVPSDFSVMSYYTSTSPGTIFTQLLICAKHVLGGDDNEEIIGVVILQRDLKWRIHGQKEREQKFETEEDRLKALEDIFRIKFSPAERDGIGHQVTAIKNMSSF